MIKCFVLALSIAGAFNAYAEVETFKPQAVSSGDCRLMVTNTDTGDSFVPDLKPLEAYIEWPGSKYLSVWVNEYPNERMVTVTPYKGSNGDILINVSVEWEITDSQQIVVEKYFNVVFTQNPDQTYDSTVIQEKYERRDANFPYNTHADPKNFYKAWQSPVNIESIQNSDGTVKVAYTSHIGLNIEGTCMFSGSVDAPGLGKTKRQLTSLY